MINPKKTSSGQSPPKSLPYGHLEPHHSPNLLKFLFDSSNDAIIINDLKGIITGWNKAAERIYGYTASEIIGKHVSTLAPKGRRNLVPGLLRKLSEGKKIQELEAERVRKDGALIFVSITLSPIKDRSGVIIAFSAIVRDITNRKKVTHALEESERKYRHLIEYANDAIFIADADTGIIVDANMKAAELTGRKVEELIGMHQTKLHPPEYKAKYGRIFRSQVKEGHGVVDSVYVLRKDGTYVPVEISAGVISGNSKTLIQGIFRNISERKKVEDLKKEFLAMAAHELKTPVTTLKLVSQAHIAKFKRYGSDQIKLEELELIDRELERLTQLINDILDETRLESGKLFLKPEQTNLGKLLKNVIKKMQLISKQKLVLKKVPGKLCVIVDQQRIEQVLVNLISNAIKYSDRGTKITIGAKKEGGKVLVWVTDEGIGISKAHQNLIFDRFYQVKEKGLNGFGLGLYITKQIIMQHRGKIWIESEPGKGSTFYFTLQQC